MATVTRTAVGNGAPSDGAHTASADRHTVVARSFAEPERLAAPSDLTPDQVRAITDAVNPLIADALAMYVKTEDFHWHVSGPHSRGYHLLLDEQADALLDPVDRIAARERRATVALSGAALVLDSSPAERRSCGAC